MEISYHKMKTYAYVYLTTAVEDEVLLNVIATPKPVLSPTDNYRYFHEGKYCTHAPTSLKTHSSKNRH